MSAKTSAGLLMYRRREGKPEVLIVHPGGPFFKNRDAGVWSIPKGEADDGETGEALLEVAKREFAEETGVTPVGDFVYLTSVKNEKTGKVVEVWMFEGDCDPATIKSNTISIDWPPRSGQKLEIPEIDRGGFFSPAAAREKLYPYQVPIIDAFAATIKDRP